MGWGRWRFSLPVGQRLDLFQRGDGFGAAGLGFVLAERGRRRRGFRFHRWRRAWRGLERSLVGALSNRKTVVPFPGNALELPLSGREAFIARIPEQRAAIGGEILDHLATAGDEAVLRGVGERGGLSGGQAEEGEG